MVKMNRTLAKWTEPMSAFIRNCILGVKMENPINSCIRNATKLTGNSVSPYPKKLIHRRNKMLYFYNILLGNIAKHKHVNAWHRGHKWQWFIIAGMGIISGSGSYTPDQVKKFLKSCQRGNTGEVGMHLKNGADPNSRHPLGWAALHVAAMNGNGEVAEQLLKAGADPNLPEEYTNIYHTAQEKRMHSIDVMVSRQQDFSDELNLRANFRGCTPLHYAVLADDIGIINLLLEAGADPLRANEYGKTPLDYAKEKGHKEICNLIKSFF